MGYYTGFGHPHDASKCGGSFNQGSFYYMHPTTGVWMWYRSVVHEGKYPLGGTASIDYDENGVAKAKYADYSKSIPFEIKDGKLIIHHETNYAPLPPSSVFKLKGGEYTCENGATAYITQVDNGTINMSISSSEYSTWCYDKSSLGEMIAFLQLVLAADWSGEEFT